jgi:hypothetical protein
MNFMKAMIDTRKALARATAEHSAPNTFGAVELRMEYGAPSTAWQTRMDRHSFSSEDGEHQYVASKCRLDGRVFWSVEEQPSSQVQGQGTDYEGLQAFAAAMVDK